MLAIILFIVLCSLLCLLFLSKKYFWYLLLIFPIIFIEPIFQKLTDPSLYGSTFNTFGFDRIKTNLALIGSFLPIIFLFRSNSNLLPEIKLRTGYFVTFILFWHIINVFFSINFANSFALFLVSIVGPILFYYVLVRIPSRNFLDFKHLLFIIHIATISFLAIGLVVYFYQQSNAGFSSFNGRIGGLLWMSNISTQVLALFFPMIFSSVEFKSRKFLKRVALVLFIFLLLISISRTAIVVYFIMTVLVFYRKRKTLNLILAGGVVLALLIFVLSNVFSIDVVDLFLQRFTARGNVLETAETDARIKLYSTVFSLIDNYFMTGSGLSTFAELNLTGFSNAHNIFFNILIERGLLGLLLFSGFLINIFKSNKRAINKSKINSEFFKLMRIGFLGFVLIGLTGNDLFISSGFINGWPTYLIVFYLAIQTKYLSVKSEK